MTTRTKGDIVTMEQYIEHEVRLRIHDERFGKVESKLNWIISLLVSGMLLPVGLHFLHLV